MQVTIYPSRARGTMAAPPSKSYAHRALICAALSPGKSQISGVAPSQDLLATMDCLRALGAQVEYDGQTAIVTGENIKNVPDHIVLPCRASGSTLRFLIPLALLSGKEISFTGEYSLMVRPFSVYQNICLERGLVFCLEKNTLTVQGPLLSGEFTIPGNISSQFISGLLFALPLLAGDSTIRIIPPVESESYIRMTLAVLSHFGVEAVLDNHTIHVKGGQKYLSRDMTVEGDWSNAAFFLALNVLGGQVDVTGLNPDSLQGDKVCLQHFAALKGGMPTIDLSHCPDLGPVAMALAAALHGAEFTGIRRLRMKESDRCAAMASELAKFGVRAEISENKMAIFHSEIKPPTEPLWGHNDHRIVMALAVLATVTGATIGGAEAVDKSLPDFFARLKQLGIEVIQS